jgi:hypothetical protein
MVTSCGSCLYYRRFEITSAYLQGWSWNFPKNGSNMILPQRSKTHHIYLLCHNKTRELNKRCNITLHCAKDCNSLLPATLRKRIDAAWCNSTKSNRYSKGKLLLVHHCWFKVVLNDKWYCALDKTNWMKFVFRYWDIYFLNPLHSAN